MALTKHQKLARGIRSLLEGYETFFQQVAAQMNGVQFYFYETHHIIGRPLMDKRVLQAMMDTHRLGMIQLSPHNSLKEALRVLSLISWVTTPSVYREDQVRIRVNGDARWCVPWGVMTLMAQEMLESLRESAPYELLYCAHENEMPKGVDWHENEEKAVTLCNQFFSEAVFRIKMMPIEKNLAKPALPLFQILGNDRMFASLFRVAKKADFAPQAKTTIKEAMEMAHFSFKSRKKRYLDDFLKAWKERLIHSLFDGVDWVHEEKTAFLQQWLPTGTLKAASPEKGPRWKTGLVPDRITFGFFLQYFLKQFLAKPEKKPIHGEIALFLWVAVHAAQQKNNQLTIIHFLNLTTEDLNLLQFQIMLDGSKIKMSLGLTGLISQFVGDQPLERQRKLFPSLTHDNLIDAFRRASTMLLPSGSEPFLPEAFLIFPHVLKKVRMHPKQRQLELQHPAAIYQKSPSRHEIIEQLKAATQAKKALNLPVEIQM